MLEIKVSSEPILQEFGNAANADLWEKPLTQMLPKLGVLPTLQVAPVFEPDDQAHLLVQRLADPCFDS